MKIIDRVRRWLVMDSPEWILHFLYNNFNRWMMEWSLFYSLRDEVRKEIDNEIIKGIVGKETIE